MAERPLSYAIVSKPIGDPPVLIGFATINCADCGKEERVQWRSYHNPYHISNHFKNRLNWDFDLYRAAKCRCPDCKRKKTVHQTDSELPVLDTFGKRFRWIREQNHLKRDDIADEAGMNRGLLEFLESGRQSVFNLEVGSVNKLIEVLKKHGIDVDREWLLGSSQQAETLARNVKREMERLSITEGALADRARVSLSAIKLILSGTIPTHYKLPDIALVLQSTPEKLMGVPAKLDIGLSKPENPLSNAISATLATSASALATAVPVPAAIFVPVDVPDDATPGQRLHAARTRKNLPQARLAEMIYKRTQQWSIATLKWMMSRLEADDEARNVNGRILVMGIIGDILGVHPDWLLGRTNDQRPMLPTPPKPLTLAPEPIAAPPTPQAATPPTPEPSSAPPPLPVVQAEAPSQPQPAVATASPAPQAETPPASPAPVEIAQVAATTLTLAEVDDMRRELELAQGTMTELQTMFDDRTAELLTLKELLVETRSSVDTIKARLGITTVVLPGMLAPAPAPAPPQETVVEATEIAVPTPAEMPAILAEGGQTHVNDTSNGVHGEPRLANGHEMPPPIGGGRIDRTLESKQNEFTRNLIKRVRNQNLTIDLVKKRLRSTLDDLVPYGSNEDVYIHALMRRETIAENGVLAKVGRGVWKYRENASI